MKPSRSSDDQAPVVQKPRTVVAEGNNQVEAPQLVQASSVRNLRRLGVITLSYVELFFVALLSRFAWDLIVHLAKRFARWQDPARLK